MRKKLNDQDQQQSDDNVNDQPAQNDSTESLDILEIKIPEAEKEVEVEVDKSNLQRKPQFRFSENNKRRF